MFKRICLVFMAVLLFVLALPLAAQNAAIVGTVKDPQDASIPNVNVTLTNQDTGVSQGTKTDSEGNYEFTAVKPGKYSVNAELTGFKKYSQTGINVTVDERARIDVMMQLGETSTTVEIQASANYCPD